MSFRLAGARDCAACQKWAKHEGLVAFRITMAGMGHLKMICKDTFSVAGAVQKTCSWERLGGQGADFLRGVAFWSIRSVGLLRWFCVTGAALHADVVLLFLCVSDKRLDEEVHLLFAHFVHHPFLCLIKGLIFNGNSLAMATVFDQVWLSHQVSGRQPWVPLQDLVPTAGAGGIQHRGGHENCGTRFPNNTLPSCSGIEAGMVGERLSQTTRKSMSNSFEAWMITHEACQGSSKSQI